MKMNKTWIMAGSALASLFISQNAFAQSTATQDVEEVTEVVVTGQRNIGPNKRERGPKAKTTIGQDTLLSDTTGNTFADALNAVPGYNFSNNDAYGSSGGEIMMRGLDSARVSVAVDGLQINDSGNYAVYTNQMIDSELLCSASVSTGATDVDSMSSSATGGTVNVASCTPAEDFGGVLKLAVGEENYRYGFFKLDSGAFGPWGTRAYIAYTQSDSDTWGKELRAGFNDEGELKKKQYNAMLYQDIGDQGSFISAAFHWNENRNHFMPRQSKLQIAQNGYGNDTFSTRSSINPSDTGNIRIKSKWVINEKLTLTVDPSFQYTTALGGSSGTVNESKRFLSSGAGAGSVIGDTETAKLLGSAYDTLTSFDMNGDGVIGVVNVYRPNITNTMRYSLQSAAIYRFNDLHTLRFNASFDRARHRQSGEVSLLNADGSPKDPFSAKFEGELQVRGADGNYSRRRDRLSYANVDVFSGEYRGRFLDERLLLSVGVRHQKLERELNQNCYSPVAGGGSNNPVCSTENILSTTTISDSDVQVVTLEGQFTTNTTTGARTYTRFFTPYQRTVSFSKTMPNVGVTWTFDNGGQVFGTYAQSMSAPRTDVYYNVVLVDDRMLVKNPRPEISDTVELGYRYAQSNFNATAQVYFATDKDRIVTAYDDETDTYTDTNVGEVERKGFEAFANFSPVDNIVLNAGLTWTSTELQQDIPNGATDLPTKGKALTGMPEWMWTFGLDYDITSALNLNLNAKYVGDRFYTYVNDEVAPHYTLWNATARYDLEMFREGTYVQLNVSNLFDEQYLHGTGYQNTNSSTVLYQLGSPRTVSLTLRTQF